MQKNYLATLFLSLGVPMLLGGDEFGRTQRGNNNAYCQDNEISWFDWKQLEENKDLAEFTRKLIAFRKAQPALTRKTYFTPHADDVLWYDEKLKPIDWTKPSTLLAYRINGAHNGGHPLFMVFNSAEKAATFQIPEGTWEVCINTTNAPPDDIHWEEGARPESVSGSVESASRSVMVLRQ